MVRTLIALVLLIPLCLMAQSDLELIELNADNLEYQAWQQLYKELLSPKNRLGVDNRLWIDNDSYSLHQAYFRFQGQELSLNIREDWDNNLTQANFSARIQQDKLLKDMALGHYRVRFGSGIALGSGSRAGNADVIQLETPPQPQRYSPFGAAVKLGWKGASALVFGSVLKREARLDAEGKVFSYPKTKSGLDTTGREVLVGTALGYEAKLFRLGLLSYRQDYDLEFVSPLLAERSDILSAYGGIRFKEHRLDLESGVVNDDAHHYIAWNYRHQGFEQNLSFAVDPDQAQMAYSTPREVLSRDPNTMELAWDAAFPIYKDMSLALRFSADHVRGNSLDANNLRTRLIAGYRFRGKDQSLSFKVSHFDREVLLHIDDHYSMTRPKHWRFELGYDDKVLPALNLSLNCRYHIEDKTNWQNNGLYWHSALRFTTGKMAFKLGYQGWQSSRAGFWYEDDNLQAYSIASKDDQNIYLSADLALKQIKLGLNLRQSLQHTQEQRFIIRLGTWI